MGSTDPRLAAIGYNTTNVTGISALFRSFTDITVSFPGQFFIPPSEKVSHGVITGKVYKSEVSFITVPKTSTNKKLGTFKSTELRSVTAKMAKTFVFPVEEEKKKMNCTTKLAFKTTNMVKVHPPKTTVRVNRIDRRKLKP